LGDLGADGGGDNTDEELEKTLTLAERLQKKFEGLKFSMENAFMAIGEGLRDSFEAMLNGESFFKTFGKFLMDMIKRLIAAAAAAAILSAILGGGAGAFSQNFKGLFASLSGMGRQAPKAFASGGIVSTPTLGLVGEYAGARQNTI